MQDIDWADLRLVLAVFRRGSYAGAARQLGVNETTVARRVARIETQLNARLFERARGRSVPTPAGERLAGSAERIEREVQTSTAEIAGADMHPAGVVRLTAVPILVNQILVPLLSEFFGNHPDLSIELIAEQRDLNLTRRETDIALRLARPDSETRMIARKLTSIGYSVYAHRDLGINDLPWVSYETGMCDLPQARWLAARGGDGNISPVTFNDAQSVCQSVRAGLGKSLLPDIVGSQCAELARITPGEPVLVRELWVMVHPELRTLGRIQAVLSWLDSVFQAHSGQG